MTQISIYDLSDTTANNILGVTMYYSMAVYDEILDSNTKLHNMTFGLKSVRMYIEFKKSIITLIFEDDNKIDKINIDRDNFSTIEII